MQDRDKIDDGIIVWDEGHWGDLTLNDELKLRMY